MNTLLSFLVIFSVLVFVHEWGHLYFAQRAGILCREFAIGMGPKLFSFKRDETIYTVRLLPIGGFVRMAGEDPEQVSIKPGYEVGLVLDEQDKVTKIYVNNKSKHPEAQVVQVERIDLERELIIEAFDDEEQRVLYHVHERADVIQDEVPNQIAPYNRQFGSKSVGKRAMAIFAGPLMNFVLAFVLFVVYASITGVPTSEVQGVTPDSGAEAAGLQENDVIQNVNGEDVSTWRQLTSIIEENPNSTLTIGIERDGQTIQVDAETISRDLGPEQIGHLGVIPVLEKNFGSALLEGFIMPYELTISIFKTLGTIITGQFSLDYIAGPVGIYNITGEAASMGILTLVNFGAMLSVNLGIVNLLPIPAMDGGRLVFIGYEAIRGKPIDPQKEGMIQFVGFAFLMLLMIVVTWNDISKLFM
ncbi:RIP metalloprotease RseP [Alkalicoccobacillus murimartini]|uniref:Zinc metalloprotease n=1 Tax=Alkalicoccobacillus murimartini TaxID=171685 RepID=A0ABT9YFJ1_9BACI|nr:RIP metalloprotease RseP [Alkalicoccobacillus murimartini]MDQ0206311.1 regulator of sigma E protease [Alkalicoccobacillus murimartini]